MAEEYGFDPNRVLRRRGEKTGGAADQGGGYGPVQEFLYKGKKVRGRRNLMTGKIQLEK
jgi:hypothetical protein